MGIRKIGKYAKAFRQRAVERMRCCDKVQELAQELGVRRSVLYDWRDRLAPEDRAEWRQEEVTENAARTGEPGVEAGAGGKDAGSGFFQKCLAESRGSSPEQQQRWRDGIYDRIGELMSLQGKLNIERMCWLAGVSRAGFYRSLEERQPVVADLEVRAEMQQIFTEHKRRNGYRRVSAE